MGLSLGDVIGWTMVIALIVLLYYVYYHFDDSLKFADTHRSEVLTGIGLFLAITIGVAVGYLPMTLKNPLETGSNISG